MMLIVGTGTLSFYRVTKKEWKERMTTKKNNNNSNRHKIHVHNTNFAHDYTHSCYTAGNNKKWIRKCIKYYDPPYPGDAATSIHVHIHGCIPEIVHQFKNI